MVSILVNRKTYKHSLHEIMEKYYKMFRGKNQANKKEIRERESNLEELKCRLPTFEIGCHPVLFPTGGRNVFVRSVGFVSPWPRSGQSQWTLPSGARLGFIFALFIHFGHLDLSSPRSSTSDIFQSIIFWISCVSWSIFKDGRRRCREGQSMTSGAIVAARSLR